MQITARLDYCSVLCVDLLKKRDLHLQFGLTKTKRYHLIVVITLSSAQIDTLKGWQLFFLIFCELTTIYCALMILYHNFR